MKKKRSWLKPRVVITTLKKFYWFFLLLFIIILLSLIYYSGFFNIKKILCLQDERPCSSFIEAELNHHLQTNILSIRPDYIEDKLKNANITIQSVNVTPKLPNTLKVNILTRNSQILLSYATSSAIIAVDNSLTPFKLMQASSQKPNIITKLVSELKLGQPITNPVLISAISLTQALDSHFISYNHVEIKENFFTVFLKNNIKVIFGFDSNLSKTVPSLQFILSQATIQPKPKTIDLRFDKPVLRF